MHRRVGAVTGGQKSIMFRLRSDHSPTMCGVHCEVVSGTTARVGQFGATDELVGGRGRGGEGG
jgi:hypothetical protein